MTRVGEPGVIQSIRSPSVNATAATAATWLQERSQCHAVTSTASTNMPRVGQWSLIGVQSGQREASMAGKDKGGRNSKTPAAKTAKEKRQSKKDKKAAKARTGLTP